MMVDPPRPASMARESANANGTRRRRTRETSASARIYDSAIERVRDDRLSRAGCQDKTRAIFRNAQGRFARRFGWWAEQGSNLVSLRAISKSSHRALCKLRVYTRGLERDQEQTASPRRSRAIHEHEHASRVRADVFVD